MADKTLINGQETDQISFLDRGLQYGDGVFETIAVQNKALLCLDEHLNRLEKGCKQLRIPLPDKTLLINEASSLIETNERGVIKIIITRGQGGRGYALPDKTQSNRIVSLYPFPDYPTKNSTQGVIVRVCDYRYVKNPALAGIKHLNRLEQVIARSEWTDNSIAEGIVLDQENNVIEGTMSNVFCVIDNVLCTPDLTMCGVEGVIRNKLIQLCPSLNINVEVKKISLEEILISKEVFICNSVLGLWPVKMIEEKLFSIGDKTQKIKQALQAHNYISS